jgi:hypothetical protein
MMRKRYITTVREPGHGLEDSSGHCPLSEAYLTYGTF